MRTTDLAYGVVTAIRRLKKPHSYRTRKSALLNLNRAVRELQASIAEQFPKLRKDGTKIEPRAAKGVLCPACRVPFKAHITLARHIVLKHKDAKLPSFYSAKRCFCGKAFAKMGSLAKHLANVDNLGVHYAMTVLKDSALRGAITANQGAQS